jgi:hypothetical protein
MVTTTGSHVSFYNTKIAAWTNTDRNADDNSPERGAFEEMQKFLVEILRCEQLIVLSGLGTSLGVTGAPAVSKLWEECEKLGGTDFSKLVRCVTTRSPMSKRRESKTLSNFCRVFLELWNTESSMPRTEH